MPANQYILQRVHRVTHVQVAGDVRRRHRDREGLAGQALTRLEVAALVPGRVPALLDDLGVIARLHRWVSLPSATAGTWRGALERGLARWVLGAGSVGIGRCHFIGGR